MSEQLIRLALPVHFVALILLAGPLSERAFKQKYGFDPAAPAEPDPVMDFGERCRNGIFGVVLLLVGAHAVAPSVTDYLGPIAYLQVPVLQWVGMAVLLASLVLIRVAQLQLKSSWRYGIDRAHPPDELIGTGLYSLSRNPIYVGLITTSVGLFLVLPNALTLALVSATVVLLGMRVRLEEQFMAETFGAAYDEYRGRTARWLGRGVGGPRGAGPS